MTTETQAGIIEQEGVLRGPLRAPHNEHQQAPDSIHNDDVAKPLGFRGGTIAGSIHMEQFPPLLVHAFGERWFENGGLSTYFRNATTDGEPVRAFCASPAGSGRADAQVDVWMERDDGMRVLEGTASAGTPAEPSYIRQKLQEPREAGELRILEHLATGAALDPLPVRLPAKVATARQKIATEPLPWYDGGSPWGASVLSPTLLVQIMYEAHRRLKLGRTPAVGLFGAIEIQHVNGPAFVDTDYEVSGTVLQLGVTPKTEYVWFETMLREPGGRDIASMVMMLRFMKASSPAWAENP